MSKEKRAKNKGRATTSFRICDMKMSPDPEGRSKHVKIGAWPRKTSGFEAGPRKTSAARPPLKKAALLDNHVIFNSPTLTCSALSLVAAAGPGFLFFTDVTACHSPLSFGSLPPLLLVFCHRQTSVSVKADGLLRGGVNKLRETLTVTARCFKHCNIKIAKQSPSQIHIRLRQ